MGHSNRGPSLTSAPANGNAPAHLRLAWCAAIALSVAASTPAAARGLGEEAGAGRDGLRDGVLLAEAAAELIKVPAAVGRAEIAYVEELDKALQPLLNIDVTADDLARLKEAFKLAGKDAAGARAAAEGLQHPAAVKLVEWNILRSGLGSIDEYQRFLAANPDWPNRWLLVENLEAALLASGNLPAIARRFESAAPESPPGRIALALAHRAAGRLGEAKALAGSTWREDDIAEDKEALILDKAGDLIGAADHAWRLDRLLTDDLRWQAQRTARAAVIRRQIGRVGAAERVIAEARLKSFLRDGGAKAALDGLPKDAKGSWAVAYHRVVQHRRADRVTEGTKLLLGAPSGKADLVNPDAWWDERRILAYDALDAGNASLAMTLVEGIRDLSVNPAKEQAFLAGFIALRYLKKAAVAVPHFETMVQIADGPLSKAKAQYWLGRALAAAGQPERARQSYTEAAQYFDTFHGQLARQQLTKGPQDLPVGPPQAPSEQEIEALIANDAVQASVIADRAGLGRGITRPFLANLATRMPSEGATALVAHLTRALGDTQQSLRIGKKAISDGHNLVIYSYPLHAFPAYAPLREPPEPAFLLAIARQESEFNPQTVSGAGARGILQVMPVTAKHVCGDYKIKCEIDRLLTDESYNTRIASAYIADRMGEFGGSYVLGLAGYNAGPGRARQWIKSLGDPRSAKVDVIDWIERLPFSETREYVGKVLSNIQIYRARLGDRTGPLRLEEDLRRARGGVGQ
ncbi:MAG: lytic transglycosylase domain-containing protein [Hyphomicrobiaceae bacterium]|nr:lytic transglycosylase domain-containing protein [Hyphomicrobiaceae bacterium]